MWTETKNCTHEYCDYYYSACSMHIAHRWRLVDADWLLLLLLQCERPFHMFCSILSLIFCVVVGVVAVWVPHLHHAHSCGRQHMLVLLVYSTRNLSWDFNRFLLLLSRSLWFRLFLVHLGLGLLAVGFATCCNAKASNTNQNSKSHSLILSWRNLLA